MIIQNWEETTLWQDCTFKHKKNNSDDLLLNYLFRRLVVDTMSLITHKQIMNARNCLTNKQSIDLLITSSLKYNNQLKPLSILSTCFPKYPFYITLSTSNYHFVSDFPSFQFKLSLSKNAISCRECIKMQLIVQFHSTVCRVCYMPLLKARTPWRCARPYLLPCPLQSVPQRILTHPGCRVAVNFTPAMRQ